MYLETLSGSKSAALEAPARAPESVARRDASGVGRALTRRSMGHDTFHVSPTARSRRRATCDVAMLQTWHQDFKTATQRSSRA